MLRFFLSLILLSSLLFAQTTLESIYLVKTKEIKLSTLVKNVKQDKILFTIDRFKHSKRIKSREIVHLLKENGYKDYVAKHAYIQFMQKSPIQTKRIETFVRHYYKKYYPSMQIEKVLVTPRSYITSLPKEYTLHMQNKSFLRHHAILILKSYQGRETFFDTFVTASLSILQAKKHIKRNEELSLFNTKTRSIHFDKFHALPLMKLSTGSTQAKYSLKEGKYISSRDIRPLFLVRRGSNVNVSLDNSNMSISFVAKALQNGCYADIIQVINHKGRRIKVKITGKHQAEVR